MNRIRHFIIIILIVLPIAILVLIRATSPGHFKFNTKKLAEASFRHANTISPEQLKTSRDVLLINLGKGVINNPAGISLKIPVSSLLEKSSQKVIRSHKGPVLIYSDEVATSAKAWMLLSEMGFQNLFILTGDTDNEVMRYKFLPDSTQAGTVL